MRGGGKRRWGIFPRAAAAAVVLLLLLGLLVVSQAERDYREQKGAEVAVQARVLAANVTAALDFADRAAAQEAVLSLRANPQVRSAWVYGADGSVFAGYGPAAGQTALRPDTEAGLVVRSVPVMRQNARIGTVRLTADVEPFSRRLTRYGLIGLLATMASLVIVVLGRAQSALRRANADLGDSNAELKRQIAERERVEAQMRQIQKMESIGQLTGGIAHDFNNMLAIVIGNLDMAARRFDTAPERARAAIGHANEGATRAAALTRRLLAFSRQQPLEPRTLDLNRLVGGMSDLLRRTLGEQIRIETVLSGGLWCAFADVSQVENAVLNLCVNARDAMVDGGNLTIETANSYLDDEYCRGTDGVRPGQYVAVAVTDTGPGMPPEVIEQAFDPFFTTKGVGKGTGLGLSQVYGFIRQSGGHVRIYSEIGQGTTVKLYLPRHVGDDKEEVAPPPDAATLPRARGTETILVVEDEAQVRRMSTDTLTELGYAVIEAANAAEALQALSRHPEIVLLFTDVVMPDLNGRQLAEVARQQRPDLPVVYTTGYTRNAIVHNGMLDHDVALVPKPFTIEQLAHKIRAVLDQGS
jgi:signal transduction histidine kinase